MNDPNYYNRDVLGRPGVDVEDHDDEAAEIGTEDHTDERPDAEALGGNLAPAGPNEDAEGAVAEVDDDLEDDGEDDDGEDDDGEDDDLADDDLEDEDLDDDDIGDDDDAELGGEAVASETAPALDDFAETENIEDEPDNGPAAEAAAPEIVAEAAGIDDGADEGEGDGSVAEIDDEIVAVDEDAEVATEEDDDAEIGGEAVAPETALALDETEDTDEGDDMDEGDDTGVYDASVLDMVPAPMSDDVPIPVPVPIDEVVVLEPVAEPALVIPEQPTGASDADVPAMVSSGMHPGDAESAVAIAPAAVDSAMHERMQQAQMAFIDDPRGATEAARTLASEAIEAHIAALRTRTSQLDAWSNVDAPDTEVLRAAMRAYRDLIASVSAE